VSHVSSSTRWPPRNPYSTLTCAATLNRQSHAFENQPTGTPRDVGVMLRQRRRHAEVRGMRSRTLRGSIRSARCRGIERFRRPCTPRSRLSTKLDRDRIHGRRRTPGLAETGLRVPIPVQRRVLRRIARARLGLPDGSCFSCISTF
jgi:hypothetical protein